jgi:hypothetical protein
MTGRLRPSLLLILNGGITLAEPKKAAPSKAAPAPVVEPEVVEVEYVKPISTTVVFENNAIDFVDGKASVSPDVAARLKAAELVK